MNIILIGMPAAGKSTAGVILAKILGYRFMDSDLLIQQEEGRLLKEIISEEGIDSFLRIEDSVNSSIEAANSVIATGGSVVYCKNAMEHLKTIGKIVYLKVDYDLLAARLSNISNRGVVLRGSQNLEDIYRERIPLYEKYADIVVEEEPQDNAEDIIRKIMRGLGI